MNRRLRAAGRGVMRHVREPSDVIDGSGVRHVSDPVPSLDSFISEHVAEHEVDLDDALQLCGQFQPSRAIRFQTPDHDFRSNSFVSQRSRPTVFVRQMAEQVETHAAKRRAGSRSPYRQSQAEPILEDSEEEMPDKDQDFGSRRTQP